ncbi:MAG: TIGR01777 family oxidoreductase [Candidatus Eremiobacteraeota bacterium]|nr:TIGR01777 family oxidoreductase [Candidatus Eremiobacteraeota bacterium]
MQVAVLGASGFVGGHLVRRLRARGDEVKTGPLRDPQAAASLVNGCDAIVNLAGEPLAQKWTDDVKHSIETSRTSLPHAFLNAVKSIERKPRIYVSASAVGYYGTSLDATFTESSRPGTDFLAHVCVGWEREAERASELGMRVACIRSGIALGKDGGAMEKLLPPFKIGAGGRVGNGKQWYSWVHIEDLVGAYELALDGLSGAINATAPNPVRNKDFTHALGKALHRPTIFPIPHVAIAAVLGEGSVTVTEGQRVLPERLLESDYTFKFPTIDAAFADILH